MIKYVLRYISVFSNVSWHCCKSFQGQRSKVKVIAELNGLFFPAEAYISSRQRVVTADLL